MYKQMGIKADYSWQTNGEKFVFFSPKASNNWLKSASLLLSSCSSDVGRTAVEFVDVDGVCKAERDKMDVNVFTIFAHGQGITNYIV